MRISDFYQLFLQYWSYCINIIIRKTFFMQWGLVVACLDIASFNVDMIFKWVLAKENVGMKSWASCLILADTPSPNTYRNIRKPEIKNLSPFIGFAYYNLGRYTYLTFGYMVVKRSTNTYNIIILLIHFHFQCDDITLLQKIIISLKKRYFRFRLLAK